MSFLFLDNCVRVVTGIRKHLHRVLRADPEHCGSASHHASQAGLVDCSVGTYAFENSLCAMTVLICLCQRVEYGSNGDWSCERVHMLLHLHLEFVRDSGTGHRQWYRPDSCCRWSDVRADYRFACVCVEHEQRTDVAARLPPDLVSVGDHRVAGFLHGVSTPADD